MTLGNSILASYRRDLDPFIVRRGDNYFKWGAVKSWTLREKAGTFKIEGSVNGGDLYKVRIQGHSSEGNVTQLTTECTCPYRVECKHAVALALSLSASREGAMSLDASESSPLKGQSSSDGAPSNEDEFLVEDPSSRQSSVANGHMHSLLDFIEACSQRPEAINLCLSIR